MVIQKFNRLIRNKWFWGIFAIIISAAFCFDDLFSTRTREARNQGMAGTLAGKPVKESDFRTVAEDLRGLGRNRDWQRKASEVNRAAWETLATLAVAERDGLSVGDAEVREAIRGDRSFAENGQFNFQRYQLLLRENGLSPEHFEQYLRRRLSVGRVQETLADAAVWLSPAELNQAVRDVTDKLTVRVARFRQDRADADKVTLDEAGLRKWYDENTNSLALPDRAIVRYVRFDAADTNLLAKMTVTEDEMHDYYDASVDRYTATDTNGVETVRKFDEVKGEVEQELRRIAALECLQTNLSTRAYAVKPAAGGSRLDEIAKEDGARIVTSGWFATDGSYHDGFTVRATSVCPGAENFLEAVAELDPSSEDLRYGFVSSKTAVWMLELKDRSAAHTPTFDEAKDIIRPRALAAAKMDAFKAVVNEIAAKGREAVLATKEVSTNYVFSVSDMTDRMFPDQYAVAGAARKLAKGEVSECVMTGNTTAILVVCEDRAEGDPAQVSLLKGQVGEQLSAAPRRDLVVAWQKWNLARLGCEPSETASMAESVDAE